MSKSQLHKRLTEEQVKNILAEYMAGKVKAKEAIRLLAISRARFYQLANDFKEDQAGFSLAYKRESANNKLDEKIEANILAELKTEKEKIIDNPNVPTNRYNYSYIKDQIKEKYSANVSVNTIIGRARSNGYWKEKPKKKLHNREAITNYIGELIQHDSSHHLFAPDGKVKWYLITSLDDHSRKILYADFFSRESTWFHISALESVILQYGIPMKYYADQHSIFRFVKDRDQNSPWKNFTKFTDDVNPQWRKVLLDLGVEPIYALSPQAKGKIERPYGWLQDHLVRTCVRKGVTDIIEGRKILKAEVNAYNCCRVHSTTGEIPDIRFNRAIREQKSLFRPFEVSYPFQLAKDIFCLRAERIVDAYQKVSLKNFEMKVSNAVPRQKVELRMYPDFLSGLMEVRFWSEGKFLGAQNAKISDLPIVQL
jgi:hypothetical protein